MPFSTIFFDLDDTLYPKTNGLWWAIRERMNDYMLARLQLPAEQISDLRRRYFETYGTTLRGLQTHHEVDAEEFLAYVHDLPLDLYLKPDPDLRALLDGLPQNKWIFTNSDAAHARRVLETLALTDCFGGIIDIKALNFQCKPNLAAYARAMELAGESDPRACLLLDDSPRNLAPARQLGFTTVLVGSSEPGAAAQYGIGRLLDLPRVLPELWARQTNP